MLKFLEAGARQGTWVPPALVRPASHKWGSVMASHLLIARMDSPSAAYISRALAHASKIWLGLRRHCHTWAAFLGARDLATALSQDFQRDYQTPNLPS